MEREPFELWVFLIDKIPYKSDICDNELAFMFLQSPTEVHKKSALLDELILLMKRNTHFVTLTLKLKWQKIKPRFTAQTLGNFSLSSIYTLPNHRYFTGLKSKLSRMFAPIS